MDFSLSPSQSEIVNLPEQGITFLEGPSGSGKTTAATERLMKRIGEDIPAENILVLVPQRTLGRPYYQMMERQDFPSGGMVDVLTIGGLAQRMVSLFWPLVARQAGFARPEKPPSFLTLETAQYFMSRTIQPFIDKGYFETIRVDRNRLYSQIIDNLNKTAVIGFPITDIAPKLKNAWVGEASQLRAYDEAQECAQEFRRYCFEHNLLDFSLQMEVFITYLWPSLLCRSYLNNRYRHLVYDNVEEDVPIYHDLVKNWLPDFESALIIYDTGGGNRSFLGADPESGYALSLYADRHVSMEGSWCAPPQMVAFGRNLSKIILKENPESDSLAFEQPKFCFQRFYPEMLSWISDKIADLIHREGVDPSEIVVLAPYLSDALRFSLMEYLHRRQIPVQSHRPSRSLRDEPAVQCLLTLACLAHPDWNEPPSVFAFRHALIQAIAGMDLTRADLLARIAYRPNAYKQGLKTFENIIPEMQERITYSLGEKFERLRDWIEDYRQNEPLELDYFLSRLFGEMLSQPGYNFHLNFDAAEVTARLIESIQKFRRAAGAILDEEGKSLGHEYFRMLMNGTISAQSVQAWQRIQDENAVLVSPAFTFLMNNQPVRYQFWLDIGSEGWWERLFQPLTHAQVLSRHWPENAPWTHAHEVRLNQETLSRLVEGLTRKCREKIIFCAVGVNERGEEIRGPLLAAYQGLRRRSINPGGKHGI